MKKRFSLSLALEFLKLMALAHCMRACRKEFLLTVEEYKTAYGRRYTLLEGKYHQDMGLYLRYRLEYREAKHNFFGIFNRLEKAA
ncbi:hypothetical protein [Croceimicrobium sp.]|uniref:hypothetical protein n=1 Tax=Croceimicrobium sp. TaxID=2828340 RepID=UPI003BA94D03